MKKDNYNNYNNFDKNVKKSDVAYSYYSRVLKEPFDSIEELKEAEEAYYAKLKAKEDKAAQKKADAAMVEEAFRGLNNTRKAYKESLTKLAERYSKDLVKLKETFEADKAELQDILAAAEEAYAAAIKMFTDKYPEGYHLTLKDGDFETTISSQTKTSKEDNTVADIFSMLFGF